MPLRDVEGGGALGDVFDAAVGQFYVDEFGHDFFLPVSAHRRAAAEAQNSILVVIAGLMEPDLSRRYLINESVLLSDSTRPKTGQIELEHFRFSDSGKWILQNGTHKFQYPDSSLAVGVYPINEVFQKTRLKNCLALSPPHRDQPPARSCFRDIRLPLP